MRTEPYRGERRNEARRRRLVWRTLDMVALSTGERRVKYPFSKGGKTIKEAKADE